MLRTFGARQFICVRTICSLVIPKPNASRPSSMRKRQRSLLPRCMVRNIRALVPPIPGNRERGTGMARSLFKNCFRSDRQFVWREYEPTQCIGVVFFSHLLHEVLPFRFVSVVHFACGHTQNVV